MGGRDGARRLVRGARGAVARAAPAEAHLASAARRYRPRAGEPAGGDHLRRDRDLPVRAHHLRGTARHAEHHRELRADLHLRDLLARAGAAERAVRGRIPRVQPVACDRPGGGVGRANRSAHRAAGAARVPRMAWPLAGRRGHIRLRDDGAGRLERRQAGQPGRRRARLLRDHLHRDGALRSRALDRPRGGLLGLLQPVLAHVADRDARARGGLAPAALRPAAARRNCPGRSRSCR